MPKYRGVFKKGKYYYAYLYHNNKRITPGHGFESAKEADNWRRDKRKELKQGIVYGKDNMTVAQLIDEYLEGYYRHKPNVSVDTFRNVKGYLSNGIIPIVGSVRLADLTTRKCQEVQNNLLARYEQNTASIIDSRFRGVLERAVIWRYIPYNPMKGLDTIGIINKKEDILPMEDLIALLYNENIPLRSRSILGLQGLGGLRVGASLAVQKEKINFNKEWVLVDLQITNRGILKPPKYNSVRYIPILPDLKPILQEYYLQVGNSKWLFPGRNDKPLHPQTWRGGHYYKLQKKYNIPINREHLLRHGFEKMLYDNGVPDREVKQIMGHKDRTMSGWYDRHSPERLVEVTRHIRFREDIPRIKLEGK